jgi:putative peptidoglycan lipid II flippase
MLGEGAIAAVSIAQKICAPVFQSAQIGIRMLVFSRSARAAAKADLERIARLHNLSITAILFFVVPIAAWYALESDVIIRAIFQRGEFDDAMAELVATALVGLSGIVLFNGANQILSNGFYALNRIRVPAISMPAATFLFLGLAAVMGPRYGVFGLTLASSITSASLGLALLFLFRLAVPTFSIAALFVSFLKYSAAALIAVVVARETRIWLDVGWISGFLISMTIVGMVYLAAMLLVRDGILTMTLDGLGVTAGRARPSDHG